MKTKDRTKQGPRAEPVGIVISRGPALEARPIISAYVWGAAPEPARRKSEPRSTRRK